MKFVAHHLWDPVERLQDATHGMPAEIQTALREKRTVEKRRTACAGDGAAAIDLLVDHEPLAQRQGFVSEPSLKSALRLAVRATGRPRQRKSAKAVTGDILAVLVATCASDSLTDVRDQTLLLTAFASGGRRRSEVANLRVADLIDEDPVRAKPDDETSPLLPCLRLNLGRTKTTDADQQANPRNPVGDAFLWARMNALIRRTEIETCPSDQGRAPRVCTKGHSVLKQNLCDKQISFVAGFVAHKGELVAVWVPNVGGIKSRSVLWS